VVPKYFEHAHHTSLNARMMQSSSSAADHPDPLCKDKPPTPIAQSSQSVDPKTIESINHIE
jgi:hypothetical protein